jgi:hypothetical protein
MTGRSPGPRSGKVPAASEMPGIPGEAGSHAGISDLSPAGQIPPGDRERLLITPLDGQPGPDAQRHAGTCPADRGGVRCRASRQAVCGVTEGLCHGGWSRVPPLPALTVHKSGFRGPFSHPAGKYPDGGNYPEDAGVR